MPRRAINLLHARRLPQLPHQRMLAPATANHQNSHKKRTTRLGRNEKLCQTEVGDMGPRDLAARRRAFGLTSVGRPQLDCKLTTLREDYLYRSVQKHAR